MIIGDMEGTKKMKSVLTFVTACTLALGIVQGAAKKGETQIPDFTAGAPAPEKNAHDWTLGPTGLRGWMFAEKMQTSDARQIYVTRVDKGSPADGVFNVGDVILGTDGKVFTDDARVAFAKAIAATEASDGTAVVRQPPDEGRRLLFMVTFHDPPVPFS